jgi:tetratricopeptide (TPR) repeat protein
MMDGSDNAAPRGARERPAALIAQANALARSSQMSAAVAAITELLAALPNHQAVLRAAANIAEQAGDMAGALQRWEDLRTKLPESPLGYVGALRTLRHFGRLDLSAPILQAGMAKVGSHRDFIVMAAQVARATKNPKGASALWQRAVELTPDNPQYALQAAVAPIGPRQGRRKRMPAVLQALEDHHRRFPGFAPAYAAHIDALRELRRHDEAKTLALKCCNDFPGELKLAVAAAGVFEDAKDFDGALAIVARVHAQAGGAADAEAAYVRALSVAGQNEAAEAACAQARAAHPKDRRLWLEYARIASRRADWDECVARLRAALQALPDDDAIGRELQTARLQLAEGDPEQAADAGTQVASDDAILMGRFESLGGSGMGCEFGMVQRRLGSDSVGLLRWARTNPPEMIAALQAEFEGVGEAEHTELNAVRIDVDREEYVTRDRRYLMESHTFVRTSDAPADRMYVQTCRRLRFLRGKMLEDLRSAEKIFVYRCQEPIEDSDAREMYRAIRSYGDNALLCVMRAHDDYKGGSLRILARGLYAGYVSHFMRDQSGHTGHDISGWTAVCRQADAAWQARRVTAGAAA